MILPKLDLTVLAFWPLPQSNHDAHRIAGKAALGSRRHVQAVPSSRSSGVALGLPRHAAVIALRR
jgi:hypothetical protein